jgi:SAM-dependent methyltransferase
VTADRVFGGSIPALYDRYLGPMIFAPYADDLAARLAGLRDGSLLETAAGTGVVTRALVSTLPRDVSIVATDLNQPMLDRASGQLASDRVTWRHADAQTLPFPDGMFDVVVCQFGVMFFPDKPRAFAEAARVLKPGGRFLFSVWDRIEENEFADVVVRAVAALYPQDPPMFLARTPHGHHDTAAFERPCPQKLPYSTLEKNAVRGKAASDRAHGRRCCVRPRTKYSLAAAVVGIWIASTHIADAAIQIGPSGELVASAALPAPVSTGVGSTARKDTSNVLTTSGQPSPVLSAGSFANLAIAEDGTTVSSPAGARVRPETAVVVAQLVPLPAAIWLFGSAFLGLCWLGRRSAVGGVGMLPR